MLKGLSNGGSIVIEIVSPANHCGLIDATSQTIDRAYYDLLDESVFAFVPRGDVEFSYRLLEVMSFGCIPIILSDGWVLPFDRLIKWNEIAICMPESMIADIPKVLARLSSERIEQLQTAVDETYRKYFYGMKAILAAVLNEAELIMDCCGMWHGKTLGAIR
jgi:hypothetical protein